MLTKTDELKDRLDAKLLALRARLKELEVDTRDEAVAAKAKIQGGISEIEETLKEGWDKATDAVRAKLNDWLGRN